MFVFRPCPEGHRACFSAREQILFASIATFSSKFRGLLSVMGCVSVHQAAKLAAALLRVAGVNAGLAESNGSLPPGL